MANRCRLLFLLPVFSVLSPPSFLFFYLIPSPTSSAILDSVVHRTENPGYCQEVISYLPLDRRTKEGSPPCYHVADGGKSSFRGYWFNYCCTTFLHPVPSCLLIPFFQNSNQSFLSSAQTLHSLVVSEPQRLGAALTLACCQASCYLPIA